MLVDAFHTIHHRDNFGGFESCPPQDWGDRGAFSRYSLFEKTPNCFFHLDEQTLG